MTEVGEGAAVRGPWWWERRRSAVLDVALALVSAVECAVTGVDFADEAGLPSAAGVLLGLVAGSVLVLRRRWPIAVVLVSIALSPAEMGVLLGFVGLYSLAVASDMPRRITVSLTVMQAAAAVVVAAVRMHQSIGQDQDFNPPSWFIPLMSVTMAVVLTAPPVLMGLYVRARRRLVESLRERADGLERELALLADRAEERAEWARSEERTRIAREMHDVVAHRVSLMVVHAAALQAVALKDPEKASKNAALVGDMGRQALTELRTMLGVLRSPDRSGPGKGSGETTSGGASVRLAEFAVAATAPGASAGGADAAGAGSSGGQGREVADGGEVAGGGPSLADLEDLVGQSRAAGMSVEFSAEGPEGPVDSDGPDGLDGPDGSAGPSEQRSYGARVERTAYRVVQEALTNVHKHAPGARTRVRLARRAGEVAVQVENGRPDEDAAEGATACPGLPSGGNGLVGMAERVNALGGGFVSGATDEGGFRVSAVIPAQRTEDGEKA